MNLPADPNYRPNRPLPSAKISQMTNQLMTQRYGVAAPIARTGPIHKTM